MTPVAPRSDSAKRNRMTGIVGLVKLALIAATVRGRARRAKAAAAAGRSRSAGATGGGTGA